MSEHPQRYRPIIPPGQIAHQVMLSETAILGIRELLGDADYDDWVDHAIAQFDYHCRVIEEADRIRRQADDPGLYIS